MNFSEKLSYLRKYKFKMNNSEFADKLGVNRNTLSSWEKGEFKPSTSHLMMISFCCGVSMDYLIFDDHPLELSLNGINDKEYVVLKTLIDYYKDINKENKGKQNDIK